MRPEIKISLTETGELRAEATDPIDGMKRIIDFPKGSKFANKMRDTLEALQKEALQERNRTVLTGQQTPEVRNFICPVTETACIDRRCKKDSCASLRLWTMRRGPRRQKPLKLNGSIASFPVGI